MAAIKEELHDYPPGNLNRYLDLLQTEDWGELLRVDPASGKYSFRDQIFGVFARLAEGRDEAWTRKANYFSADSFWTWARDLFEAAEGAPARLSDLHLPSDYFRLWTGYLPVEGVRAESETLSNKARRTNTRPYPPTRVYKSVAVPRDTYIPGRSEPRIGVPSWTRTAGRGLERGEGVAKVGNFSRTSISPSA